MGYSASPPSSLSPPLAAEQLAIYNTGLIASRFYQVLGARPVQGLHELLVSSVAVIVAVAVCLSLATFVQGHLTVLWRRHLTTALHAEYCKGFRCYYVNNLLGDDIDNPDQRITQDVDKLAISFGGVLVAVIITPLTIVYYTYNLSRILGFLGPVAIYGYFIAGAVVNRLLMTPLVRAVMRKERREGDFRFAHVHSRVKSESAAFYRSAATERQQLDGSLQTLMSAQRSVVNRQLAMDLSVNLFDYVASVLSYFIVAVPILAGRYDDLTSAELSSVISKSSFISMYLLNCFTTVIDKSQELSDMAGYAKRIRQLHDVLVESPEDNTDLRGLPSRATATDIIHLENVSIGVPRTDIVLLRKLNVRVARGSSLLITGSSGTGKTSLTRVLLGLWPVLEGRVSCPTSWRDLFFLPQKPYMTHGSLFEQVVYPQLVAGSQMPAADDPDPEMLARARKVLDAVGLTAITHRVKDFLVDPEWDWYTVLSQGELQRLAFARMLYHAPAFAVLDEATSAVGEGTEANMYRLAGEYGVSVISVGHRSSLFPVSILATSGCSKGRPRLPVDR